MNFYEQQKERFNNVVEKEMDHIDQLHDLCHNEDDSTSDIELLKSFIDYATDKGDR